ncbi:MAG: hypothetical protein ABIP68_08180, partial [Ferruginibacter sp.]
SGVLEKKTRNYRKESKVEKPKIRSYFNTLIHLLGLNQYKSRLIVSEQFENWVKDFDPDYIYTQLSNLELIHFVNDLHGKTQIPIAIHIMDDWPITIGKEGILASYWNNKIHDNFRDLVNKSSSFFSISEAMSEEYLLRYSKKFIPFHNPVDIDFWKKDSKNNYEIKDTFKILYAGRIGTGIRSCFVDIAIAINNLNKKGYKIELQMQITNDDPFIKDLSYYECIKFNKMIPYGDLPKKFAEADLLLLPNDFEAEATPFLKYSMPTKASEYMISGTPILLYARLETAITAHAIKHGWAYIVSERGTEFIENAIVKIIENLEIRRNLGVKAQKFAQKEYDGYHIREQFCKAFKKSSYHKLSVSIE